MNYKINGKVVTKKEWDAHYARKQSLYGMSFSDMLQSPPGVKTDDTFLAGVGNLDQQIKDPAQLEHIVRQARKHGYNPKHTDFYNEALASFAGDPKAFLNHGQAKGHLKKTLEERGYRQDRDGDVSVVAGPLDDPYVNPEHRLHPKIVKRIKRQKIKDNPDLAHVDQRELEADIVANHGWNETR